MHSNGPLFTRFDMVTAPVATIVGTFSPIAPFMCPQTAMLFRTSLVSRIPEKGVEILSNCVTSKLQRSYSTVKARCWTCVIFMLCTCSDPSTMYCSPTSVKSDFPFEHIARKDHPEVTQIYLFISPPLVWIAKTCLWFVACS